MRSFAYERVHSASQAIESGSPVRSAPALQSPIHYLAGGTTLLDLMKLDVMQPATVVDINGLRDTAMGAIEANARGLRLGALVRMAEAAEHPSMADYPVIAQSLELAASPQLRNMATLGGNVLQRTRCNYFREISNSACNKREPGSGCAARDGFNRQHAVLGTSEDCIATYPGDFAQALIALDASVEIAGPRGIRGMPFAALHRLPGDAPEIETTLEGGELISAFFVPAIPWFRRSLYLKIRDRQSYEFALASAAVALDLADGVIREARIALGGVATVPWRARQAEAVLRGAQADADAMKAAANSAFASAQGRTFNAYKIELGKRTLVRALAQAARMEI